MNPTLKLLTIFSLLIFVASCTSTKSAQLANSGNLAEVLISFKKGIKPEDPTAKGPFRLVEKVAKDHTENKWLITYDLGKYTKNDLINYLINLDNVVSVDGKGGVHTPPIKGPNAVMKSSKG